MIWLGRDIDTSASKSKTFILFISDLASMFDLLRESLPTYLPSECYIFMLLKLARLLDQFLNGLMFSINIL